MQHEEWDLLASDVQYVKLMLRLKVWTIIVLLPFQALALSSSIEAQIGFQGDVVHFELSGQNQWVYDLDQKDSAQQKTVELIVAPLSESSVKLLEKFKSPFVKSIQVDKKSIDQKYKVTFILAHNSIETFDYLTEGPSRLVVDFFEKEDSKTEKTKVIKPVKVTVKTKIPRAPATTDILKLDPQGPIAVDDMTKDTTVKAGIYDGADPQFERFQVKDYEVKEEAIIRSRSNFYIRYPMLEAETPLWAQIKNTPPMYQIKPQENLENKQMRLLLGLFEKKRYLVFQKTLSWFRDKYPDSQYNDIIDFMAADVEMEMWKQAKNFKNFETALELYKQAIQKHLKSPLAEKVSLLIGIYCFDRGDYLTALRLFQEHISNPNIQFQGTLSKDLARLGQAQVYDKMRRTEEAFKITDDLEKNSVHPEVKSEAAYRRGDISFRDRKYSQAVSDYEKAIKKYPQALIQFPGAIFNQAESLFWQDKYRESLQTNLDFVKKFPMNDQAAFSITRMGETLEILGVDPTRVMGAFLETYFRFGENPKAIIARIRLLSGRMKNMKTKEVEPAIKEVLDLAKKLDWPQIESFSTILLADGYTKRGEYSKSIELLARFYQTYPSSPDLPLYQGRLVNNINELIQKDLQSGHFIDALKTHQKFADNWLKNSDRLDTQFSLGRAYELGGALAESEKYYKETLNRYYAIQGTNKGKELAVLQKLPSDQSMNLRLAVVKFEQAQWSESYDFLKNIKKPELMSESEQIERVILAAHLLEKRGDLSSASRYLSELLKTWKGQAELVAGPYLQLAEIEFKQGKKTQAVESLEKVRTLAQDSGAVQGDILSRSLHRLADTYIEEKKDKQAIEILDDYLEKFEDKKPLASQRYRLGLIYFQNGEVQKAAEAWSSFKGEKSTFWQSLAQEKLKDSKWKTGYKKYIQRIPAMVNAGLAPTSSQGEGL